MIQCYRGNECQKSNAKEALLRRQCQVGNVKRAILGGQCQRGNAKEAMIGRQSMGDNAKEELIGRQCQEAMIGRQCQGGNAKEAMISRQCQEGNVNVREAMDAREATLTKEAIIRRQLLQNMLPCRLHKCGFQLHILDYTYGQHWVILRMFAYCQRLVQ